VDVLYDPRYHGAGRLLELLAVGTWLQTVSASYGILLLALGRPKFISLAVTLRAAIFFGLVLPVFHAFGAPGVAGLAAVSELGVLAGCLIGIRDQEPGVPWRTDLAATALVLLVALALHLLSRGAIALAGGRPAAGVAAVALADAGLAGLTAL